MERSRCSCLSQVTAFHNEHSLIQNLCRQSHICIYKLYEWVIYSKLLVLLVFLFPLRERIGPRSWPDGPHNGVLIPCVQWMEELFQSSPYSPRIQASICWEWPNPIPIVQSDTNSYTYLESSLTSTSRSLVSDFMSQFRAPCLQES